MRIIISGAGEVGFHIAKLLAEESHAITLIDLDQGRLDYVAGHLDIFLRLSPQHDRRGHR